MRSAGDWLGGRARAALALVAVYTLWMVLGRRGGQLDLALSDLAPVPLALLASATAFGARRSGGSDPRGRRAFGLIGLAFASWALGDAAWAYQDVVLHTEPFPSVADACYLAFYLLLVRALVLLGSARRSPDDRVRLRLDLATTGLAATMVIWHLVLAPSISDLRGPGLATTLLVAYPVADIVVLFALGALLLRGTSSLRRPALALLAVATLGFVVADIGFARLDLTGSYHGIGWPDAAWMLALACSVAGLDAQRRHPSTRQEGDAPPHLPPLSLVPYLAIGVGALTALAAAQQVGEATARTTISGAIGLIGLMTARQVTLLGEHRRLLERVEAQVRTDSLTGLSSRTHVLAEADAARTAAGRSEAPASALVLVDVDHFKGINDRLGHAAGDDALVHVASMLRGHLRPGDVAGRYGGDEFLVVLRGTTPAEAVAWAGEATSLRRRSSDSSPLVLTTSAGVAALDPHVPLAASIRQADAALYAAKRGGRDRVVAADDVPTPALAPEAVLAPGPGPVAVAFAAELTSARERHPSAR